MALAGMDAMRFLTTTDEVERVVMQEVASRVNDHRSRVEDQNRAVRIANSIWGALKK